MYYYCRRSKSVSPTKADWNAALRVLRYLLSTPDRVLTFVPPSPKVPAVAAYVDAAWANAPRSRSRYGLIVCVYGCPVLWITKLTSIVCLNLFVRPIISRAPTYPHVQLSRAPQLIRAHKYLVRPNLFVSPIISRAPTHPHVQLSRAPQLICAPTYLVRPNSSARTNFSRPPTYSCAQLSRAPQLIRTSNYLARPNLSARPHISCAPTHPRAQISRAPQLIRAP